MTSHVLKFVDFTKAHKSRYVENEALFSLQINSLVTRSATLWQKNTFVEKDPLKLVSAIFLSSFYFLQMIALQKL